MVLQLDFAWAENFNKKLIDFYIHVWAIYTLKIDQNTFLFEKKSLKYEILIAKIIFSHKNNTILLKDVKNY